MRSPGKLITAISFIRKQNKISKGNLVLVIILMFASLASSSQATRALKTDTYKRIVSPNAIVKVQTIEDGRVSATHDVAVSDVQVPVNKKSIISYDQKISAIDTASYKKFTSVSPLLYSREELKIIPELHVETQGSATEAYRIVFTLLQPFRYNNSQKKFNASLGFFLMPESGNSTGNVLEPVKIEVVSNDVTLIHPDHLQILHLNLPSSKVELTADHVSDSTSVKVITTSNPDGYVTYLKVNPSLEIISNRSTLQGLGIQKIPIEVRFIGSN